MLALAYIQKKVSSSERIEIADMNSMDSSSALLIDGPRSLSGLCIPPMSQDSLIEEMRTRSQ